jgi:hypothetical protein
MTHDWSNGGLDESYYTEPGFIQECIAKGVASAACMQLWTQGIVEPGELYLLGNHHYAQINFGRVVNFHVERDLHEYPDDLEGFVRQALASESCRGLTPLNDEVLLFLLLKMRLPAYDKVKFSGEPGIGAESSDEYIWITARG